MSSAVNSFIATLCLVAQLFGAALGIGQAVCVGEDGHLSFELAHAGDCTQEAERHHGTLPGNGEVVACAGHGCTDFAISELPIRNPRVGNELLHAATLDSYARLEHPEADRALAGRCFAPPEPVRSLKTELRSLRTVVLLV